MKRQTLNALRDIADSYREFVAELDLLSQLHDLFNTLHHGFDKDGAVKVNIKSSHVQELSLSVCSEDLLPFVKKQLEEQDLLVKKIVENLIPVD